MPEIFSVMAKSDRAAFRRLYLEYQCERNGTPAPDIRVLPHRENRLRQLETMAALRPTMGLDECVFGRNLVRTKPEPGLDSRILWALSMAKISRMESYGVDYKIRACGFATAVENDPHLFIELEELYHSRLIAVALRSVGLDTVILPPSRITQLALKVIMRLPHALSDIAIMAAEVAGVTVFRLLAEKACELFQDTPEALAGILEPLAQLLLDEVGHVYYVRSCLNRVQLTAAWLILPLVARALLDDTPEIWLLLGRDRLLKEMLAADIPAVLPAFASRLATFPGLAGDYVQTFRAASQKLVLPDPRYAPPSLPARETELGLVKEENAKGDQPPGEKQLDRGLVLLAPQLSE